MNSSSGFGRRRQRGVSMIEVLVTVVVLAIGLVGLGAMQLIGMQSNQGAYYRTQATFVAYELLDNLRAERGFLMATGNAPATVVAANNTRAADVLPQGGVAVVVDNAARGEVTITVSWLDDRADAAPNGGIGTFVINSRI